MVTLYKVLALAFGILCVLSWVLGKPDGTLYLIAGNTYMILAKVYE